MASAYLIAMAVKDSHCGLFGCVALVPLFAAIRLLKPAGALVCGALWGACFCCGLALPDAGRMARPATALLFVLVPALYAGGAAVLTGRFGFQPLLLALGWLGPDYLLHHLASAGGLPLHAMTWGGPLGACSRVFGWLAVVVLVVYVNAKLVAVLGHLPDASRRGVRARRAEARCDAFAPSVARPLSATLSPGAPRAPPPDSPHSSPQRPGRRVLYFLGSLRPGRCAGLA